MKRYYFKKIINCDMCGDNTQNHKVLGLRSDQSQGFNPKKNFGIAVAVQKCTNCNLIYANPQPIPNDLQDHYGLPPDDYWKPEFFTWHPSYLEAHFNAVKKIIDFKEGMKALDIGAGIGKTMRSMEKAGFDAYGIEPSVSFYEGAISTMKINKDKLKLGAVENLEFEQSSFDFITFSAVFEHLYEPSKCLAKAVTWLKPNGVIHIEVPSSGWLISKLINLYYCLRGTNYVTNLSPMHIPFHLYEFELKSFVEISKKLGLKIEKYSYNVCTLYYIPKLFHPILRKYMQATNSGMEITVFLRKK